jgi:MarR family transcriptional regulator, organic hydroperoxide resistance regulator
MADSSTLIHHCLYFTANNMARIVTRLAEDAFKPTGLSPSHAFVLMVAAENPGIGPGELAGRLALAPSTVTRFVDALVARKLLVRTAEGRASRLSATSAGLALLKGAENAWKRLHKSYAAVLGPEGDQLAEALDAACRRFDPEES